MCLETVMNGSLAPYTVVKMGRTGASKFETSEFRLRRSLHPRPREQWPHVILSDPHPYRNTVISQCNFNHSSHPSLCFLFSIENLTYFPKGSNLSDMGSHRPLTMQISFLNLLVTCFVLFLSLGPTGASISPPRKSNNASCKRTSVAIL